MGCLLVSVLVDILTVRTVDHVLRYGKDIADNREIVDCWIGCRFWAAFDGTVPDDSQNVVFISIDVSK